jgi:hypothetical protein
MRGQKLGFAPVLGQAARREHWGGASEGELGRRWRASGDAGRDGDGGCRRAAARLRRDPVRRGKAGSRVERAAGNRGN